MATLHYIAKEPTSLLQALDAEGLALGPKGNLADVPQRARHINWRDCAQPLLFLHHYQTHQARVRQGGIKNQLQEE